MSQPAEIPLEVLAGCLPYFGAGELEAEHVLNRLADAGWVIVTHEWLNGTVRVLRTSKDLLIEARRAIEATTTERGEQS